MDNTTSVNAVNDSCFSSHFRKPLYGSYCFSGIPGSICELFGIRGAFTPLPSDVFGGNPSPFSKVAVIFVDAFGWNALERYSEKVPHSTVQYLRERGICSKLTSQFPSTTACHVTTIHTGMPVHESGICEWFYYEHALDAVISPLKYSFAGDDQLHTLIKAGIDPHSFVPLSRLYPTLRENGVRPVVFLQEGLLKSPYNVPVLTGAEVRGFKEAGIGLSDMSNLLLSSEERLYTFFYFNGFDSACHEYGPGSREADEACHRFFDLFEKAFLGPLKEKGEDIALMVISDHGQKIVSDCFYLERIPGLESCLLQTEEGRPILGTGSQRDCFLHVRPECLEKVQDELRAQLGDFAEVYRTEELVRAGVFEPLGERAAQNLGNLVILPSSERDVFWSGDGGRFEDDSRGKHGGLSPEEMDISFVFLPMR